LPGGTLPGFFFYLYAPPVSFSVACSAAECLDLLRLFFVEVGELISRFAIRP
jgi:hypothetical protein